jgi:hypothetical protein
MTGMPRVRSRLAALGSVHPSLALFHGRIGGRRPTGVGGVRVHPCCERVQALEEGQHGKTHTQRGLVPIFSWDAASLWQGGRITPVAHDARSFCFASTCLSQTCWQVRSKGAGEGLSTRCRPRDHIRTTRPL